MKKYAFIYNPAARGGRSKSTLAYLKTHIGQMPNARLFQSQSKDAIPSLVDELLPDFDIFIACGGDGTVREVASQLIDTEKTMGIIPIGTGNDLCKSLNIPVDLRKSFKMVLQNRTVRIDVGQCNDFIFLNSLGFGFDGLTNRYALEMEPAVAFLQYILAALKATIYQDKFTAQIKREEEHSERQLIMATIANGKVEGGSFWIAPEASVRDGKLNLVTVAPISKWLIPFLLPLFLVKKASWIPQVQSTEAEAISIQFDEKIAIHADGEVIKMNTNNFFIRLMSNELEVICGL